MKNRYLSLHLLTIIFLYSASILSASIFDDFNPNSASSETNTPRSKHFAELCFKEVEEDSWNGSFVMNTETMQFEKQRTSRKYNPTGFTKHTYFPESKTISLVVTAIEPWGEMSIYIAACNQHDSYHVTLENMYKYE